MQRLVIYSTSFGNHRLFALIVSEGLNKDLARLRAQSPSWNSPEVFRHKAWLHDPTTYHLKVSDKVTFWLNRGAWSK